MLYEKEVMDLFEEYDCEKHKGIVRCLIKHHNPIFDGEDHYGELCTVLGEITNMPGHVIFFDQKGTMHSGYHDDNFLLVNDSYFYEEVDGKSVPRLITPEIKARWKAEDEQHRLDHPEDYLEENEEK